MCKKVKVPFKWHSNHCLIWKSDTIDSFCTRGPTECHTPLWIYLLQVVSLTPNQTHNLTQSSSFKQNLRALKNLALVMGLFIVSWMPYLVLTLIQSFDPVYYANHYTISTLQRILFGLFLVNSIVNPIIYGVRFRGFNMFNVALRLMFGCIRENGRHAALESVTSG